MTLTLCTLTITNVKRSDAGKYVCNATNKIDSVSASAYLDVQCKYIITFKLYFQVLVGNLVIRGDNSYIEHTYTESFLGTQSQRR